MGVTGPIAEIGPFEGRFSIALAHALAPGEKALGIDLFDWPNPEVIDRFEANCARHGIPADRRITWKADSRTYGAHGAAGELDGRHPRFIHIDGEHSRAALTRDLELATAVLAPEGVIVLDDMLHPGYPTLMVAVHEYLGRHPEMCVLCVIDRETVVAATKFVLCRRGWFKRYEEKLLEAYKDNVWPLGADFEPHWCPCCRSTPGWPSIGVTPPASPPGSEHSRPAILRAHGGTRRWLRAICNVALRFLAQLRP